MGHSIVYSIFYAIGAALPFVVIAAIVYGIGRFIYKKVTK